MRIDDLCALHRELTDEEIDFVLAEKYRLHCKLRQRRYNAKLRANDPALFANKLSRGAAQKRERYRADPEYRERTLARNRARRISREAHV